VAATPGEKPANPAKPGSDAESLRAKYGVQVVLAGFFVVLAAFTIAVLVYDEEAADVSTALAPVTAVIGTIVGAYFGVQVGSSGKKDAEKSRDKAEDQAKQLAAVAPTELSAQVLGLDLSSHKDF